MSADHRINRRIIFNDEECRYPEIAFSHEYGSVRTYLDTDANRLHIDDIVVSADQRRKGIGNALLRSVRLLAEEIQAEEVTARIVSRECLDAVQRVFGAKSVHVRVKGDYDPGKGQMPEGHVRTSATLRHQLK